MNIIAHLFFKVRSILLPLCLCLCLASCSSGLPYSGMSKKEIYSDPKLYRVINAVEDRDYVGFEKIINEGGDVNLKGHKGVNALYWFVLIDDLEGFIFLLNNGADINAQWESGSSLLHILADFNNIPFIKAALKYDADINIQMGSIGSTPLMTSVNIDTGDSAFFLLLEAGGDPYVQHKNLGLTVYNIAVLFDRFDLVIHMIELGYVKLGAKAKGSLAYSISKKAGSHLNNDKAKQFKIMVARLKIEGMIE